MNRGSPLILGVAVIVVLLAVLAGGQVVAAQLQAGPEQPVGFTHLTHAGTLQMDCTFCHRNVEKGANASVPAVQQCMFCHSVVSEKENAPGVPNAEIAKAREAYEAGRPIDWMRVHRLPDHVRFIHEAHVRALGPAPQSCTVCHGDIKGMQKVSQVQSLKMGDCVSCHRGDRKVLIGNEMKSFTAPTDCTTCHR
ncbi:MAG: cytochrome C [Dehalococcoidia bacterium]|nr:cytochrome C [Dehalococcoidia bacterium]